MSAADAARATAEFGVEVFMVLPEFADEAGEWLPYTSIAASVWGR